MYKRFLNNHDYLGIITEEAMKQLIRNNEDRISQAEEAAEASIVEYLTDNYEVEKELMKGKMLVEYTPTITYPVGVHFYKDGKIYEALRSIAGVKTPTDKVYWVELDGYDASKIENAWEPVENVNEWVGNYDGYHLWSVVSYEDKFYALVTMDDLDLTVNPFNSNNWGLIGDYVQDYPYEFKETEYVVYNGQVYVPTMKPTADELKEGYNIRLHDPRNSNIKKHLVRLALYELHKLISPNNVSSARITDYEASIMWLRDANRCKINPQIPRKLDFENKPVAEYAIATFMRDYDPNKNPWQI